MMNETVRIIAMSDLHERFPKDVNIADYDICVIAGDFCSAVISRNDVKGSKRWLSGEGRKWLEKYPCVQFVIIPGNHDLAMNEKSKAGDFGWPANVELLIDRAWTHPESELRFYGSPWSNTENRGAFSGPGAVLAEKYEKIPEGMDIVVTHSPPDVLHFNGTPTPVCSPELTKAIERAKPTLLLCGHEHKLDHRPVMMSCGTMAINLSLLHHKRDPHVWRPREIVMRRSDEGAWRVETDMESDFVIKQ